jgi:hypothetical protein
VGGAQTLDGAAATPMSTAVEQEEEEPNSVRPAKFARGVAATTTPNTHHHHKPQTANRTHNRNPPTSATPQKQRTTKQNDP